jgi:hypothetical protein
MTKFMGKLVSAAGSMLVATAAGMVVAAPFAVAGLPMVAVGVWVVSAVYVLGQEAEAGNL